MMTMSMSVMWVLGQAGPSGATTGSQGWLIWGIVLLAVALAVFFVELFVPTGGLLGFVSGLCAVAGIVCLFRVDTMVGLVASGVAMVSLPFLLGFAFKIWPDTPFAKWITLRDNPQELEGQAPATTATADGLGVTTHSNTGVHVGDLGETVAVLRPVGTCRIQGKRVECLAKGGRLEPGVTVRVVAIEGGEVWVQAVDR